MTDSLDKKALERLLRADPFTAADRALARLLEEQYSESDPFVLLAGALTLAATREGHSFLDLSLSPAIASLESWPTLEEWKERFAASLAVQSRETHAPLVFEGPSALYLRKYFEYENRLAGSIARKALAATHPTDSSDENASDLQAVAVSRALENRLYLISGGPGTGKTTTVLDYLIQALQRWTHSLPCRIAAVAPTGKAAARLSESIQNGLARFTLDDATRAAVLGIPCMTVHRLLQGLPNRASFRRNQINPIAYDLLIVDESSMIDLPLMEKLFNAIPEECSIVLLGDHNQLSSVEVGSVFGDLLRSSKTELSPLYQKSTSLEKTYRFSEDSSIHRFCEAAKSGDAAALEALLQSPRKDFEFISLAQQTAKSLDPIVALIVDYHSQRLESADALAAYQSINRFALLTPFNRGPFGAYSLNRLVDAKLRRSRELAPGEAYPGMPLIVLENNYDLELFNGDIGIIWPDGASGELFAWFADASDGLKRIRINRLPKYEYAFCLTIHKSQGSEFDHVAGLFPIEENDFVSRELVYTCASRAKTRLSLFGNAESLTQAIQRAVKRATQLEEQILTSQ